MKPTMKSKLGCGVAMAVLMAASQAHAEKKTFNVPAEDAGHAIAEFARQASIQVVAPVSRLDGVKTHEVVGVFEIDAALKTMLSGTGLEVVNETPTLITLRYKGPVAAPAQPVADATPAPAASGAATEVVIVGSQIRGAKTTGALPVSVIGRDDIAATGAVSGDDLFRSIPQAGDVQFQESRTTGNLNDARGDTASINIRSLGTGNTLVLLNGRRVNFAPGVQTENFVPVQTVNTNSLPMSDVRRIEILRDGAAAIYGTDAIAGVVNVVLDDNYKGVTVSSQYGAAKDYQEGAVDVKAGTRLKDGTKITFFGNVTGHTRLMAGDRDYSESENHMDAMADTAWAADTAFDNRSTSSAWGSFTVIPSTTAVKQGSTALTTSGVFHVEPTSNTSVGCSSTTYDGNLCLKSGSITGTADRNLRYDEGPQRSLKGQVERFNAFSTITHDFGDVTFFGEGGVYHAYFNGDREQSAALSSAPISIAANAYYNPFGPTTLNGVANPNRLANLTGVPTTGLAMNITTYRPVDAGPRHYNVTDDSFRALGGLRGTKAGWDWESAVSYSWARTADVTNNAISNTLFQAAINRTTADAYNPFNGGDVTNYSGADTTVSSPSAINSFLISVKNVSYTSLATWDYKLSKADLFHLPGGDVGIATGLEAREETYKADHDKRLDGTITYTNSVTGVTYGSDVMGASGAPDVKGARSVVSAYVEFAVPVISPEMHVPLVQSIDLQIAGRAENYSDFGGVAKPKIAGLWKVASFLSFRGSYSEGYRAPNLPQYYSDGSSVSNSRTDWAACRLNNTTCSSVSTLEVRSGNKNLTSEDTVQRSAGVIFSPTFIPSPFGKLTVTADYWNIHETNVIGIEDAPTQILYDLLLRQQGSSNPNVVRLAPTAGQTVGTISYVNEPYTNLEPRQLAGIDYDVDYRLRTDRWGQFGVHLTAANLSHFYQAPDAVQQAVAAANAAGKFGTGITLTSAGNQIGINGNPAWRGSATLSWKGGPWSAGLFVNHVGSVYDTSTLLVNNQYYQVKTWTTLSLYGSRTFDTAEGPAVVRVGVRNLADKAPPLSSSNVGYFGSLADPMGRYTYVSVSKAF